jgi:hypothetical protein
MRTVTRLSALILAAGLLLAACGSSKSSTKSTTTSSTTTTTATTTTTTAVLTSNSALAVALDESILSGQQVQAALGLSAAAQPYAGTAAAPAPPQGGLSLDGVAKVFPDPSYKGLLEGNATVGANRSYLVPAGTSGYVLNILAIKFNSQQAGSTFVTSATQVATTFGGAATHAHPEVKVGLTPGAVLVVPPRAPSTNETVVTASLYADGVYYLISTTAPVGAIQDEVVIKVLKAEDAKYSSVKAKIDSTTS